MKVGEFILVGDAWDARFWIGSILYVDKTHVLVNMPNDYHNAGCSRITPIYPNKCLWDIAKAKEKIVRFSMARVELEQLRHKIIKLRKLSDKLFDEEFSPRIEKRVKLRREISSLLGREAAE